MKGKSSARYEGCAKNSATHYHGKHLIQMTVK